MSATTVPGGAATEWRSVILARLRNVARGRQVDPAWARPALFALLVATAGAYMINLTASGDANSFYAAAVQAGTESWKALFFGSLDKSNFITVDKPPAALWMMALSGRIFGFSSASMLAPEVLEGVIAVALLNAAVRRWFGAGAGLLAGSVLALTPVAALMFRFNNPDALLVCLLVGGAYAMVRALDGASTRWIVVAGTLIGFAFLAKMLQAFLVVPAFAAVYLLAVPTTLRRRCVQMLYGGVAILVSAGWWVAIVALWPAGSRPMIDGSSDNSILNLIFGYNGFGRLLGSDGQGGGGANFSGSAGVLRLFDDLMGGQASWLLPACVVILISCLWLTRRAPRTDRTRAALLLWGGWLLVSGLAFSFGQGVIHTYYTVALAPAIAALVAVGAVTLWRRRTDNIACAALALCVLVTAGWAFVLLDRTPSWEPWLRPAVVVTGIAAAVALLVPAHQRVSRYAAIAGVIACLAGPTAYTIQTLSVAHTGSTPSAGPELASTAGGAARVGFPGGGAAARVGGAGGPGAGGGASVSSALVKALDRDASSYRWVAAVAGSQTAAPLELATDGKAVMAIGGFSGLGGNVSLAQFERYVRAGDIHYYVVSTGAGAGGFGAGFSGAVGFTRGGTGLPDGTRLTNAGAGFSGPPPGGGAGAGRRAGAGFSGGSRPGGGGRPGAGSRSGGSGTSSKIAAWIEAHFKREAIGTETVYNLTEPT